MRIVNMLIGGVLAHLLCDYGYGGTSVECFHAYLLGAILGGVVYVVMTNK